MELKAQGKLLAAERQLVEALGEEPGNAAYQLELANIYATRYDRFKQHGFDREAGEMLERVERELEKTVMLRPKYVPAQFNLAVVQKRRGRFEDARVQFKKVLEGALQREEPETASRALMQIGSSYEEQGFYDDALDYYEKAREFDYYNKEIRAAIEELKIRRKQSLEQASRDDFRQTRRAIYSPVRYSPDSPARRYQSEEFMGQQSAGGAAAIIPVLGAMLAQQFMQRKSRGNDNISIDDLY